jgi:hypothetical protein
MYQKLISMVLGVLVGVVVFISMVRPWLKKTCLIDTDGCVKIRYQKKDNSVLVHVAPSGKVVWFDGKEILLYNEPTGRICDTGDPAYVWTTPSEKETHTVPQGYMCAKSLKDVEKFYDGVEPQFAFMRSGGPPLGIFDILNHLSDLNVIDL